MSKHRTAPSSDFCKSSLIRASRSRRSRSKSIRCSQSTAIVPYVLIAKEVSSSAFAHLTRERDHVAFTRNRRILERRRERYRHVLRPHAPHRAVEVVERLLLDH